jgi:putative glutamine amidotransferase
MKKFLILLIIANFYFISLANDTLTILLIHPTVKNINTFNYLSLNKIIDIDNVKFIGVYHKDEQYDYSKSKEFIADSNLTNFSLVELSNPIEKTDIYKDNNLSSQFDSLFLISNAAIFTGGDDISPSVYGNKTKFLTSIDDPYRHYFEISFLYHLIEKDNGKTALLNKNPNYAILGICLGMQTINVAAKGTMYQDIPTEVYKLKCIEDAVKIQSKMHKNYSKLISDDKDMIGASLHPILLKDIENPISKIFNDNKMPYVLSWHHQAVKKIGNNLKVIFTSEDKKIVEGLNHTIFKNVYGVQFHPEYIKIYKNQEIRFKLEDKQKAFADLLKEKNSYQFHIELWRFFSSLLSPSCIGTSN